MIQHQLPKLYFFGRLSDTYHLNNQEIIIEEDNFEEGLTGMLITAGIDAKNIHTGLQKSP
jgi:hypothetical protein